MRTVVVSLEGVNLPHVYIVREMSLYFPDEDQTRHYIFTPPPLHLSPQDQKTDWYQHRHLGGISLRTPIPGSLDYGIAYHQITK